MSTLIRETAPSVAVGTISYAVYLPEGYAATTGARFPVLYLLHGRGDTMAGWQQEAGALDELIASGAVPPVIAVMPDAPWSDRSGYYTDSLHTGSSRTAPGFPVETAFTSELVPQIDARYRTVADRGGRILGGNSMGGAGALRYALAHQDLFSAAIALSPAVYLPVPPDGSSARESGAFGVGTTVFDEERYRSLNYPAALAALDPALPVYLFIGVGDDEYVNPLPEDAAHDLDYEAATLYNRAKRAPGVTADLRVYGGGHDWDVWDRGLREGLTLWSARLDP